MTFETPAPRADFPVLSRDVDGTPITYLDSAATTLKPDAVIDAVSSYYRHSSANVHRGQHMLSDEASDEYEKARRLVAEFIGAQSKEVVFTRGTTAGINQVAAGMGLSKADTVLVTLDAHHSNLLPWRQHAGRVVTVDIGPDGRIPLEDFADALRHRPRVVALTSCSNVTGVHQPIEDLIAMARLVGATVLVDAAQSAGHRPLRVHRLDADFVTFSAHKMLGPTGLGVLYGREEALERLEPVETGGGMVDWVADDEVVLRKLPYRLEAGTPDIAAVYGMGAAIRYLEGIGLDRVEKHCAMLAERMCAEASSRDYLTVLGGADPTGRAPIVSLSMRGARDLKHLARSLSDSFGVMCRSGHLCAQPLVDRFADGQVLRMSAYAYTTEAEIVRAFSALDTCYSRLGAPSA